MLAFAETGAAQAASMHPIPPHEFRRRLDKWRANPTRRLHRYGERGRLHLDYCMEGRVFLRVIRDGEWAELWGDRGVRNFHRPHERGRIAFNRWDEPEFFTGDGKPHRMPTAPRRL